MRLLLNSLYKEVMGISLAQQNKNSLYADGFESSLIRGVSVGVFTPELLSTFNVSELGAYLDSSRDQLFEFMGLQTIYEKYLFKVAGKRIELPQYFWMRIAMGVALAEKPVDRTAKAKVFYDLCC